MKQVLGVTGMIIFSFFAYWQLNDLEQYGTQWWQGWFLTYALTAVLSLLSCFMAFPRWFYWAAAAVAIAHAVMRGAAIQPENKILYNPDNPAGNEAGGLVVVCIWLLLLSFWGRNKSKN